MPSRKLTPIQVLERLLTRLERRMEALQRVKLDGFQIVIAELEVEQDYCAGRCATWKSDPAGRRANLSAER